LEGQTKPDTSRGYNSVNPWRLANQFSSPKTENGEDGMLTFSFHVQTGKFLTAVFYGIHEVWGSVADMSET